MLLIINYIFNSAIFNVFQQFVNKKNSFGALRRYVIHNMCIIKRYFLFLLNLFNYFEKLLTLTI